MLTIGLGFLMVLYDLGMRYTESRLKAAYERKRARQKAKMDGRDEAGLRDIKAEVTGALIYPDLQGKPVPQWLNGTFYRQSGGAFLPPSKTVGFAYVHGLAHIAAFKFQQGVCYMTNKCIRTKAHETWLRTRARTWANPHEMAEAVLAQDAEEGDAQRTAGSRRHSTDLGGGDAVAEFVPMASRTKPAAGGEADADADADADDPHYPKGMYEGPNPNVTVWRLGQEGEIAALSEAARGRIIALDGESLETKHVIDTIDNDAAFLHAAHFFGEVSEGSKTEVGFHAALTCEVVPGTDQLSFGYAVYHGDAHAKSALELAGSVEVARFKRSEAGQQPPEKRISYMHTLAVTTNFVVLFGSERRLDYELFLAARKRDPESPPPGFFQLWPGGATQAAAVVPGDVNTAAVHPTLLHVFKRRSPNGHELEYLGERALERPQMIWHTANAYEQGDNLIIDVTSMIDKQRRLVRFTVEDAGLTDMDGFDSATELDLSMDAHEFPAVSPHYFGREHQYVYALSNPYKSSSKLWKYDVVTGKHLVWQGEEKQVPSEPVFVPNPEAVGGNEDDGVVLSIVNDDAKDQSFLLLLDARTFEELTRFETPLTVNHGLHSVFIPSAAYEAPAAVARY